MKLEVCSAERCTRTNITWLKRGRVFSGPRDWVCAPLVANQHLNSAALITTPTARRALDIPDDSKSDVMFNQSYFDRWFLHTRHRRSCQLSDADKAKEGKFCFDLS